MKTLNLGISLEGLNLDAETVKLSATEIATKVIKNVIVAYGQAQRGLSEEERRLFYKVSDALEAAKDATEVALEDTWFGFVKKCFKDSRLMPDLLLRRVEEKISEVKDR